MNLGKIAVKEKKQRVRNEERNMVWHQYAIKNNPNGTANFRDTNMYDLTLG